MPVPTQIRGWVGPRAGLDSVREKLLRVPGFKHRIVQDAANPNTIRATPGSAVTYTGCNRRKGPDFGRVFLMLNYTENPQNTYIQS